MPADLQRLLADLTSGDDSRAEAAAQELAALGDQALEPLLDLLRHEEPDRRWWAVRALAAHHHPRARSALARALHDADPAVRQCAALALRQRPFPETASALAALLGDEDRMLARLAADALTALGPRAVPALAAAARDPDPAVRIEAVRALANLRRMEAAPALFRALDDPSTMAVHWAEEGLERLGIGMVFFRP